MNEPERFDVIIIGGGPAGATAGMLLAREGVRTVVLEKATFPRFHIGESLLPRNFPLLCELGLEQAVRRLPHTAKYGVEFAMGDGTPSTSFTFDQCLLPGSETINVERAPFDDLLLARAREAGADVRQGAGVRRIVRLADGDVAVEADGRAYAARFLIDASGQGTVVGRHLGTRRASTDPRLRKVAYFAHFEGVWRAPGRAAGSPCIVMAEEGWFWIIPLDERRTSVGLVLDPEIARTVGIPPDRMLAWGIARCPTLRQRMAGAIGPERNEVVADFSYSCHPYAGPGYFLVGDAATFLDPIFSTGVTLAMVAAQEAARLVTRMLRGELRPAAARRRYARYVQGSSGVFFRLIRQFYDHSFREMFLNGAGPAQVHRAVLSILAGEVFPRPPWCLRWRLRLFELFGALNRRLPMVPRRARFSLMQNDPSSRLPPEPACAVGQVAQT